MCLLAIVRNAKKFEKIVDKVWEANPDGAGLAWRVDEGVQYRKGLMDLREFRKAFNEVAKLSKEFVVHFRLGTSGPRSPILTHPFVVSPRLVRKLEGVAKLVVFHNGVVAEWEAFDVLYRALFLDNAKALSDTEAIARILSKLDFGARVEFLKHLGGKWLVYGKKSLLRIGKWEEVDGNLLSNKNWQTKVKYGYSYYEYWFEQQKKNEIVAKQFMDNIKKGGDKE